MHIHTKFDLIFFSRSYLFELRNLAKMKDTTVLKQFVSATLAKIILCNSDETSFLSDCPSLMLGIAICCMQHSQTMFERGVCEPAYSFFHKNLTNLL